VVINELVALLVLLPVLAGVLTLLGYMIVSSWRFGREVTRRRQKELYKIRPGRTRSPTSTPVILEGDAWFIEHRRH